MAVRKLQLKVEVEGKPEHPLGVTAFVFDQTGALVATAPVKAGKADVTLPDDAGQPRILLAPGGVADAGPPTLERLVRAGAHEASFVLRPGDKAIELQPVPEIDWRRWPVCRCRVRGRVVRSVAFPAGVQDMPICKARVHVCEVDRFPFVIAKLPDSVLERLRGEILVGPKFPFPEPDPPPFVIDPGFVDPSPELIARSQPAAPDAVGAARPGRVDLSSAMRVARRAAPVLGRVARVAAPMVGRSLHAEHLDAGTVPAEVLRAAGPHAPTEALELDAGFRAVLQSDSMELVRRGLIERVDLLRPYLCWWRWLWPWFTCDEVAVIDTDENGRFDTTIWYPCLGDRPDIYVWVEYRIGGTWTTVYRPHMACNTYWDYECGRELTVRVTDPRVPWCGDPPRPPGSQVVVVAIGYDVGFVEVQAESAGATAGLTTAGQPLGGSLEPAVLFGTGLPAGVSHYRWSVRRQGEPDSAWRGLDDVVGRHYLPPVGDSFLWFPLGPDVPAPQGAVFKIQPQNPPSGSWASSVDVRLNNATAFFRSWLEAGGDAEAGQGKYELKLELFRIVGGVPQRVNLTAEAIALRVLNVPAPTGMGPAPHVPAPAANLLMVGANVMGFRWLIHVDNNRCWRDIADVIVGPNASGPCGFIQYDPAAVPPAEATIAFRAFHPHGFATFGFDVAKGSSGSVASASGSVTQASAGGFTNLGNGWFTRDIAVAALLGSCTEAAFAETLDIDATATDGWSRLSYLDSGSPDGFSSKAFALEPQDPT